MLFRFSPWPTARPMARAALVIAVALVSVACASDQERGVRIDPDAMGSDQGTLISIGDIRSVAQVMIDSMNESPRLAALRKEASPLKILEGEFKQRTSIAIFDKRIFVNRVLSSLISADKQGVYEFIRREDVQRERELQATGAVETSRPGSPPPKLAGAEYVLSGEVRELLHRETVSGGGELEKRTIQYTLRLTRVADGTLLWTNAHEIVKMQIIGAVYR